MLNIPEYRNAERVFHYFEEISKIPHGSGNTAQIADYLVSFARDHGLEYLRDEYDNVIIRKPATRGYENRPTVIFQGHTDMVADKVAECDKDMDKEGLSIYRDGDYIRAKGTTLGGDDGVAIAYSLAVLEADDIEHPEFEALFTSDEEIGLIGAAALDASALHGKTMINIDSDMEGIFTAGCAGGIRMDAELCFAEKSEAENMYEITVSGLIGGHSGTEIDKGRANAIKLLSHILSGIKDVRISEINGGNADNAIPRSASAIIQTDSPVSTEGILSDSTVRTVSQSEPNLSVSLRKLSGARQTFNKDDSSIVLSLLNKMPTGVYKMNDDIPGLPETSSNLGIIETVGGRVNLTVSVRSSKNSEKAALCKSIRLLCEEHGATVSERGEYPGWEFKKVSHLREVMSSVYSKMYGKEPQTVTIHAGLECGIFSDKIPELDCVSIGPDNLDIHTPEERLSISSTARVWEFLKNVLKEI